jgi:REP element-mobilizing transposase RayT
MSDINPRDEFKPAAFDSRRSAMVSRRNMPHWRQEGAVYFVTFRLADSLPQECLAELRAIRGTRLQPVALEDHRLEACATEYVQRLDRWLHKGHGNCCLAEPAASEIVEKALHFFDGQRYALGSYVIMPNHVHVLVAPTGEQELTKILHSWKSFTAKQINTVLCRQGTLWQDESFDHIVRSDESLRKFTEYIEQNPVGLPPDRSRAGRGSLGP